MPARRRLRDLVPRARRAGARIMRELLHCERHGRLRAADGRIENKQVNQLG